MISTSCAHAMVRIQLLTTNHSCLDHQSQPFKEENQRTMVYVPRGQVGEKPYKSKSIFVSEQLNLYSPSLSQESLLDQSLFCMKLFLRKQKQPGELYDKHRQEKYHTDQLHNTHKVPGQQLFKSHTVKIIP